MKIGIIGAGFTGLAAGYSLASQQHDITIFEKDSQPGGLAIGYQEKNWDWTLEKHYHHWFTNDDHVLKLAQTIHHDVVIRRPHTNWYVNGHIYEFDSIAAALRFPPLPLIDRIRNLATLGLFRFDPFWQPLERVNADVFLPKMMGKKAYSLLWEPLFKNKFGEAAKDVSLAWFWARIKKRTQSLAYPVGGFLRFAESLTQAIEKKNGRVHFDTELTEIHEEDDKKIRVSYTDRNGETHTERFDKVIVTLPSFLFLKITPQLPEDYRTRLRKLKGLGATNLVLRLKKPFFSDHTYWLSVADKTSPIMAIVEHTNFMDKKHYDNEHLVYLGNYVSPDHEYFSMNEETMLKRFDPFLKKINPTYQDSIIGMKLFKAPFAQPIIPVNYSKILPPMETPLKNVILANIEQVYPWDRGTNYAVELGEKAAYLVQNSK
jgi:protoporphyrinogen oxidase